MTRLRFALAAVFALSASVGTAQQAGVGYHITKTYELGGDGGWDYIVPDPSQHRVYIGRTRPRDGRRQTTGSCSARSWASRERTAPPSPHRAAMASPPQATINRS